MAVSKRKRQELLHAAGTFWSFLFLAHIPQSSWQWAPLILQGCSQSEANANNGRCPMKSTPITISINLILGFLWSSTTCPTRLWWNAERDHFEQSTLSCWKRYQTLCQHQTIQHWTLLFQCRHFLRTKIWRESQEMFWNGWCVWGIHWPVLMKPDCELTASLLSALRAAHLNVSVF